MDWFFVWSLVVEFKLVWGKNVCKWDLILMGFILGLLLLWGM